MEKTAGMERNRELEKKLVAELGARPVRAFRIVSSTMEEAHRWAADGAPEGALVFAERQEQGRGRLGRVWESPAGGIYLSLILRPSRQVGEIPQLSLAAGLAAAEAVRDLSGLFPSIRWPNDLLIGGKKVGGILVEARSEFGVRSSVQSPRAESPESTAFYAVIGIGINVTTKLENLPETATSLMAALSADSVSVLRTPYAELGYRLTGELCHRLQKWYDKWIAEGFAPIREALRPWIGLFGHPVHITAGRDSFEGTAADVDESGRLMVRLDSGIMRPFEMGEVALLR